MVRRPLNATLTAPLLPSTPLFRCHVVRVLVARQRPFGGKENRRDPAKIVVRHQARLNINGWKAASCCNVTRPWRASSSTATKLEARAERRYSGSAVGGRNCSREAQSIGRANV